MAYYNQYFEWAHCYYPWLFPKYFTEINNVYFNNLNNKVHSKKKLCTSISLFIRTGKRLLLSCQKTSGWLLHGRTDSDRGSSSMILSCWCHRQYVPHLHPTTLHTCNSRSQLVFFRWGFSHLIILLLQSRNQDIRKQPTHLGA